MTENYIPKVLTVDDNHDNNYLVRTYLKLGGIEAVMAESAHEALELIDKDHFSMFILDIMMSSMSGFELAVKIREIDKHKLTPIIFTTAIYNDESSIIKGYELGAIDYLFKPVVKEILIQKVQFFLTLDKQRQKIIDQRNKLIESQKLFFDVANSIADWIWEIDLSGKFVYISEKIEDSMAYKPHELIGKSFLDLMSKENAEEVGARLQKIMVEQTTIKNFESWQLTKTGEPICLLTNGVPIFDSNNQLVGYRGVNIDITGKVKSDEELNFQAKLLQSVNDSVIFTNLEGVIDYVNNGTSYTFGYKPIEIIGNTLSLIYPEQYKDLSIAELFIVIDFKPYESVWQGKNKNGDVIWLDVKINLLRANDGKPEGYIVVNNDITLLKKAQTEVISSLIKGENNERKRIASDLHDGLGQILTASLFNFNSINNDIGILDEKKLNKYNNGLSFLSKAIGEVRNIAYNLMPKSIEHFGLISAISTLFTAVEKSSDFEITISENIGTKRLDNQLEINMYRITQELLNNAVKYSSATMVSFQYQLHANELIFMYEDDGVGFDYEEKKTEGDGLNNIKNRVASLSGFLSINSTIGKGTSISIEIAVN